jgi:hypothetical protein
VPGSESSRLPLEVAFAGEALIFGALGVSALALESETESQLRVWRISQGREARTALRLGPPTLALVSGGAAVGLSGMF